MERFFDAQSVAVVGVSVSPDNLGRSIVWNLVEFGFGGRIYLVGTKSGSFIGHKIYPSVSDLPETPELAVLLIPAAAVPDVLEECGAKGIRRVVVESGGFGEMGEDRASLEERTRGILGRYQMRMIGPNCIGIMNRHTGLALPFLPLSADTAAGGVSILSQSGGVGAMMIFGLGAENIGFAKFASIGNKLDVKEGELLDYVSRDEQTRVVFVYLEGISEGRAFMEAAARSPLPVIVQKASRGKAGAQMASSHSAALSADDRVVDAAIQQSGAYRVIEQPKAMQLIKSFLLPPMRGKRVAILSRSGGHAVMAADAVEEFGLRLPNFPPEMTNLASEKSRARVISFQNPMDLGDLYDLPTYRRLVEMAMESDDYDGIIVIHTYLGSYDTEESRGFLIGLHEVFDRYDKPMSVCVYTSGDELHNIRKKLSYPVFLDPREAVEALWLGYERNDRKPLPFAAERPEGIDPEQARVQLRGIPEGPVRPDRVALMLEAFGVQLVPWRNAGNEREAAEVARELGFPVAMKTAARQVVHKSDVGGVALNLSDEASVMDAYNNMTQLGPDVMLQKMGEEGSDWMVGGRQDRQFGPVVIVGLGGIYVEVFRETALRIGPLTGEEASRMLGECRGSAILEGIRGQQPLDREALLNTVERISWLLYDFPEIRELDLNPVRVLPHGAPALDWRMVFSRGQNSDA